MNRQELQAALTQSDLEERLVVTPLLDPEEQLGAASIDLRLGTGFLFLRRSAHAGLDPRELRSPGDAQELYDRLEIPFGEGLWLHPQQFVLGSTLEFVRMPPNLSGTLVGRSSWARLGLVVETAGLVQPGFAGTLTYELVNSSEAPIKIYPGLRVAQLSVHRLGTATELRPAKYLSGIGPETSRLAWEADEFEKVQRLGASLSTPATAPIVKDR